MDAFVIVFFSVSYIFFWLCSIFRLERDGGRAGG